MVGTSFSGTSIHCYDKHQQKKKYYDAIDDNNTMTSSTSTITTTATSLHSSIRDHDDDTELLSSSSSSSSPLMSFDFHELQHNDSDKSDDKSTHNDDNNNNNKKNNSSSSSMSSASASASSSSYWSLYQYVDLRYTMLSNLIFLLGSSCQTYLAIIDLRASIRRKAEMENDDYDYDYDYYYAGDDTYVYTVQDDVYYILYGLGPFLCIINACIDLRWQLEYSKISPLSSLSSCCRRCWCFFRGSERKQQESVTSSLSSSSSITSSSTLPDDYDVSSPLHYEDSIDDSSLSTFHSTESSSSSLSGEYWGYVVVSLFGLGSVLSFYSTFLDDYFEDQDKWDDDSYLIKMEKKRPWYACNYKINFIAIHLYLLSGVVDLLVQRNSMSAGGSRNKLSCDIRKLFSVCFNRSNTNNNNNTSDDAKQLLSKNNSFSSSEEVEEEVEETTTRIAKLCMFIGTFLFVSGTLLDCTIAILYDPQQRHELNPDHIVNIDKVLLGTAGLTSCLLWTIDAILYIIADFFLYSLHIEDSKARRFLSNGFKIPSSITDHTNDSDSNHHSDTATTASTIPMQFIEEKQQHKLVDVLLSSSTTNETVPLLLSSDDEPHKYYNRV